MNLALSDEQAMVRDMVRRFLADRYDATTMAKGPMPLDEWRALGELGLFALLMPEQAGGLGGGAAEVMIVSEEMGRALAISPLAESILLCGRAIVGSPAAERWGERLLQGDALLAFARGGECADGKLSGLAAIVRDGMDADAFVVEAAAGGLFLVDVLDSAVRRTPVRLVDGSMAAQVHFDAAEAVALTLPATQWDEAQALAGLSIVAELVGAMATLLDLTVDYVGQRRQFGKPIASFQVVQHRCARMYTWLEQSRSMLLKAALVEEEERVRTVTAAKAYVGDAALKLAEEAVQLHGGMGVTDELAVGRGLRRVLLLSRLHGGGSAAREALAA
ncbi:MAG: acyl-CoA dehydrogenase [Sphingobium sp.]|jgi:alkylation response protein AidB-like acyl-CoA dehydrogenase|uniref:acyl-CoA dehydrogenase family protein n=1 Tax=Sphingobium sp. TaxID=1912891 RepID=UPI000C5E015A|nr:acyl-CoA dehydrogenase family protein [Sphingobium sp.]MBU0658433.1 acyl-CoA/acyl-ACP dehydrogenase [Alphaproteobacteria bacterium]MBA4753750.1 acyl-CoA dehydrogenase family protein [Sphingobium sp.]MBS88321.1 acyl-CoA dehydrogenase [Sphingobium sp.]MBU0776462.1 acyl-CoA/acyl-ACP dehydrogenase [Alphaproteobacteria bacterium]MBU0868104.1 acyl-CoA/acyl-ACP dehydrogenase [Alphaproteobacteria bacterium]